MVGIFERRAEGLFGPIKAQRPKRPPSRQPIRCRLGRSEVGRSGLTLLLVNVHSLVRAKTKPEAEQVGKYMIRPLLSLERLTFLEPEGKV